MISEVERKVDGSGTWGVLNEGLSLGTKKFDAI